VTQPAPPNTGPKSPADEEAAKLKRLQEMKKENETKRKALIEQFNSEIQ
jgi:hypothetical protein